MQLRRLIALVTIATFAVSACGSSGDSDSGGSAGGNATVAVGEAPPPDGAIGGLAGAVAVAAGAPGEASAVACTVDRQALELAIQSYEILHGSLATSQQELLDAQVIRELSVRFEVTPEGALVPAVGSPCS